MKLISNTTVEMSFIQSVGTAPLDGLSPSGAYSTRLLRSAYTGPTVKVRRSSDNATLDFVGDKFGNLSNTQSAVTIDTWLTSTTGNVTTWYDQAYSNNFIQVNTINQPQIVKNGGKWGLFFNRNSTPTFYSNMYMTTNQTGIYSIVYNFNVSSTFNAYQTILGGQFNDNRGFRFTNNLIYGDAAAGVGRYGQDFLTAAGSYWYLNNQYGNMTAGGPTTNAVVNPAGNNGIYTNGVWNYVIGVQNGGMNTFVFNSISSPATNLASRAMYGYLSELLMFKTQLSDAQARSLYATMTITPLVSKLTRTPPISATGGNTVQDIGGYRIHTFTATGTQSFTVTVNQITGAKILVVAGGGGGGQSTGGGGGAGGLIYTSSTTLSSGTYSITVGGGGAGSSAAGNNSGIGFKGGSSIISGPGIATQTAIGGGGGGHNNALSGSGGSGGGAVNSPGGAGTAGQGNPGGSDSGASYTGAGGGGAGQAGQNAAGNGGIINGGGNGGNGLAYDISGTSTYYAGGGGGGSIAPRPVGSGGLGGGGSAVFGGGTGGNGTANTGGGGAGGTYLEGTYFAGGNGGSGIVIVAYPIPTGTSSTMTGTPLFSQLSASATSSAVGAFSLRAVNGTTVKAVQIKRQSDNATQDFYADRLGNLLAAPVTGQTLQNWLGSSSGNVVTWYDQSGAGRNATGTQSTIVRTSNVNQQWAVNPTNGGLSLSGGTFLNGTDFTITCTTKRLGTQGNDGVYGYGANTSWVSQASVPTTYGNNTRFALVMPNAGSTDVRFNDSSFSAAFSSNANVVPSSFVAATEPTVYTAVTLTNTTQRMYINGTANGVPISTLTQLTANASTGFTIGTVNFYGSFLGEIGELIIFNNALSTSDISTLYSAR